MPNLTREPVGPSVDVELANDEDLLRADASLIESVPPPHLRVRALVDSRIMHLRVPESIARAPRLQQDGISARITQTDDRNDVRLIVTGVRLAYAGRSGVFRAIVEPDGSCARIGTIALQELDLVTDTTRTRMIPRDPERIITAIE
jgi:hypothetical protein